MTIYLFKGWVKFFRWGIAIRVLNWNLVIWEEQR